MSGINLNAYAEDRLGHTPLHRAARYGDKESVELLIANGAEVNVKENSLGYTPLGWARLNDVAEILIAKGADVNAKDKQGGTPLLRAASQGFKERVELLIANGAGVNAKDNRGRTPLWYARDGGHTEIVELLRKHGARE